MRSAKILSVAIPLILFSVSLIATSVSAGPIIISKGPVAGVLKQIAGLILQAKEIEHLLPKPVTDPTTLLDLLREFEVGLGELEAKLQSLIELGKIEVRLKLTILLLQETCTSAITGLTTDLAKTPPILEAEHIKKFSACRKLLQRLRFPHSPRPCRLVCPLNEQIQARTGIHILPVSAVIRWPKIILNEIRFILKSLSRLEKDPSQAPFVIDGLSAFQTDLAELKLKVEGLRQIGKVSDADAAFVQDQLNSCIQGIDSIKADLSQTPPMLNHPRDRFLNECVTPVRLAIKRLTKPSTIVCLGKTSSCGGGHAQPTSETILIYTLTGQPITNGLNSSELPMRLNHLTNSVHLIVRTYPDGHREIVKVALIH